MKISCTKAEKEMLVSAIATSIRCLLHGKKDKDEVCARMLDCRDCAERNIEWDVKDGGGHEES